MSRPADLPGRPAPPSTQVLIAGGGPVGLCAAVELGLRGIACVLVEPRAQPTRTRPRAKTLNIRTMEHLRRWGVADALRSVCPLPTWWSQDVAFCTALLGREITRFTGVLGLSADGVSPELGQQAPQYVLEETLREIVHDLPSCTFLVGSIIARVLGRPIDVREIDVGTYLKAWVGDADPRRLTHQISVLRAITARYSSHDFVGNPNGLTWLLQRPPTSFEAYVRRQYDAFIRRGSP